MLVPPYGFRTTNITQSPRRNILDMNRSLLTGLAFFLPLPRRGCSVHISLTFSSTMLQWRSNALTRPSSFLLLRQLTNTWVLFFTDWVRTESGPVLNSSSSRAWSSSEVISDFGFTKDLQHASTLKVAQWGTYHFFFLIFDQYSRVTAHQKCNRINNWQEGYK